VAWIGHTKKKRWQDELILYLTSTMFWKNYHEKEQNWREGRQNYQLRGSLFHSGLAPHHSSLKKQPFSGLQDRTSACPKKSRRSACMQWFYQLSNVPPCVQVEKHSVFTCIPLGALPQTYHSLLSRLPGIAQGRCMPVIQASPDTLEHVTLKLLGLLHKQKNHCCCTYSSSSSSSTNMTGTKFTYLRIAATHCKRKIQTF